MSLKAITWVMESAPVQSPAEMVILYALADRAHDDGSTAWPSYQWIADRAVCSRRTVIRHINAMESRGLIKRGDQRFVQHLPSDKRPTVWDLDLSLKRPIKEPAGCQSDTPKESGVSSRAERGVNGGKSGVSSRAERGVTGVTQSVLEPSLEPSLNHPPNPQGGKDTPPDRFPEFYEQTYPRRVGRLAAERAWKRAIKNADPETIIAGARRYSEWCREVGQEVRFIAHPSTWLNRGGWDDELDFPMDSQGPDLASWGAPSTKQSWPDDPFANLRGPVIDHEEEA